MNKVYIAIPILVFIIAGELIGITIQQVKNPPEDGATVLGAANNEIISEQVKKYCENYHFGSDKLMQTAEVPKSITKCGNFYRVEPPISSPNSPVKMINKKGEMVAMCGAVSFDASIETFENKKCQESCDFQNLCNLN